jgi:hypothetical protein
MKLKTRMSLSQQWHSSEGVWIFINGSMELFPGTTRLSLFTVSLSYPRTTTSEAHRTVSIPLWDVLSEVTPCSGSQCFLCKGWPIKSLSGTPIEACFQGGRRPILGPRPRSRKRYSRKQRRKNVQEIESTMTSAPSSSKDIHGEGYWKRYVNGKSLSPKITRSASR